MHMSSWYMIIFFTPSDKTFSIALYKVWLEVLTPNGIQVHLSKPIGVLIIVISLNFSPTSIWLYADFKSILKKYLYLLIHGLHFQYETVGMNPSRSDDSPLLCNLHIFSNLH